MVREADPGEAAAIDLHVVTAEVARTPGRAPALELHIGRHDGASHDFEVSRSVPAEPDLLAELSMARAQGRALRGADPAGVIGPVPHEWVAERGRHWLTVWQGLTDDREHAVFMVVTACRMWRFAVEGVHCSKGEAAAWALRREPSLDVVRQAVAGDEVDERGLADLLALALRETGVAGFRA
ncbi:aminoglycoside adenylyltransferase domain-containing protein [Actinoplanes sp. NPDC051861]|uniref:aminoglycoside adenylyltransferase domain-containing protein n=1 Tax=Actinoplanes sp. NPDC051861 TaxID=3155170 RepID=UPI00343920A7